MLNSYFVFFERTEAGDGFDVAGIGDDRGKGAELFELAGHDAIVPRSGRRGHAGRRLMPQCYQRIRVVRERGLVQVDRIDIQRVANRVATISTPP